MQGQSVKILSLVCLLWSWSLSGCSGGGGGGGDSVPLSPQPEANVSLSSASSTVSSGAIFTRTVEVENVGETFYVAFDLTYDPNVVEYVDATEGTFLSKNGSDATSFHATLQNEEPGRVTVGLTRLGEVGEVSGSGTMLTLTFRAVGSGTTLLTFSDPKGFKNSSDQDVTVETWEDGTVTVP